MSILNKVAKLANSPEGRRLADKAKHMAKDPETRRKLEEMRGRVARKKR